jgi:hypothetical protein
VASSALLAEQWQDAMSKKRFGFRLAEWLGRFFSGKRWDGNRQNTPDEQGCESEVQAAVRSLELHGLIPGCLAGAVIGCSND